MSNTVFEEAQERAEVLFEQGPPSDQAYDDQTPVTITVTKGQAYRLRGNLRLAVNTTFQQASMLDMFGGLSEDDEREMTNIVDNAITLDAVLAEHAPVSDYPREDQDEPALV